MVSSSPVWEWGEAACEPPPCTPAEGTVPVRQRAPHTAALPSGRSAPLEGCSSLGGEGRGCMRNKLISFCAPDNEEVNKLNTTKAKVEHHITTQLNHICTGQTLEFEQCGLWYLLIVLCPVLDQSSLPLLR